MIRKLLAALALVTGAPAVAGWQVATSNHFVVYSSRGGEAARDAASRLERFEHVLRFMTRTTQPASPVKVSVFLLPDAHSTQAMMAFGGGEGVAGFYDAGIRGPFAIMSARDEGTASSGSRERRDEGLHAEQILFHELTHHFTFAYYPAAYPVWYTEGFADYIGSMRIGADDRVSIGAPVNTRYLSFSMNQWLPMQQLLTARSYADVGDIGLLYSEGWLLVHYLSNTTARPGQLGTFLNAINKGQPPAKAAVAAFGDLSKLDGELRSYASRQKLQELVLPFKKIDTGEIRVRALTPAEEAMLPYDMRLFAGIPREEAGAFAGRVAAAARPFGDDPQALRILFEAQQLASQTIEAAKTADHWAQVAPGDGRAIAAQADVQTRALADAKVTEPARWSAVRRLYAAAVAKAPDNPRTLRSFYETYRAQGVMPPESAQNALYQALLLLPQDDDLRQEVAADFEARGMIPEAITVISPIAYQSVDPAELSPRKRAEREKARAKYRLAGKADGETAREMLSRLQSKAKAAPAS